MSEPKFKIGQQVKLKYHNVEGYDVATIQSISFVYNEEMIFGTYSGYVYNGVTNQFNVYKNTYGDIDKNFSMWPETHLEELNPNNKVCNCDLMSLMQRGCTCGGV